MLKKIGTLAREDLEHFYGMKVNLQLYVQVRPNWRNQENALRAFGFDTRDLLK